MPRRTNPYDARWLRHHEAKQRTPPAAPRAPQEPYIVARDCYIEDGAMVVFIDRLYTQTEANTGGEYHAKAKRAKEQRSMVYRILQAQLGLQCPFSLPLTVTVTRIAPSAGLDPHDGLPSSQKHVVDGIADYLAGAYGKGQDRQDGLRFLYAQRRGAPQQYAVEIRLEAH